MVPALGAHLLLDSCLSPKFHFSTGADAKGFSSAVVAGCFGLAVLLFGGIFMLSTDWWQWSDEDRQRGLEILAGPGSQE